MIRLERSGSRLVAIALLALFVGCPSPQPRHRGEVVYEKLPTPPPDPKGPPAVETPERPVVPDPAKAGAALAKAEAREAAGDALGARALLHEVTEVYPETPEAVAARVTLAEDALEREDFDAAKTLVVEVADQVGPPLVEFRRRLVLAQALEGLEDYLHAARAFAEALLRAALPEERQRAATGVVRNAFRGGAITQASETVRTHLSPVGASDGAVRLRLVELVAGHLPPATLARLYRELPRAEPLLAWVALQYAQELCGQTELRACAEAAELASGQAAELEWKTAAERILERVRAWNEVRPRTIGVLLPESGPYAGIGKAARAAVELALEDHPELTIVWRDTAGDEAQAAQLTEALILEEHVAAILGPVGQKESGAAAEMSARYGIPHVVLSSADAVAEAGPAVLRLRLSAVDQGRAVARYAVAELDASKVAILFPDNAFGQALMGAFWDEVVRLGGEVWAVETYAAGTTEFSPVVKALLGADKPGEGDAGFRALFIPDGARSVRRLVPFLKFWGVAVRTEPRAGDWGVQLLGGSGWNHPSVIDRGDNLTDNAVFVDAYVHDPDDPEVDRFTKRFYTRHRSRPRAFHAEVYDATHILARSVAPVAGADHAVRQAVLGNLTTTRNHAGATGLVSVLDDGTVLRKPRLLTIDLDDIRPRLPEDEERATRDQRFLEGEGGGQ